MERRTVLVIRLDGNKSAIGSQPSNSRLKPRAFLRGVFVLDSTLT